MDTNKTNEQDSQSQTDYQTPEIIDYGLVHTITQSAGGLGNDVVGGESFAI